MITGGHEAPLKMQLKAVHQNCAIVIDFVTVSGLESAAWQLGRQSISARWLSVELMKQEELARTFARKTHQSKSAARDQLDQVVHSILTQLRKGRPVELPGIGKLTLAGLVNLEQKQDGPTK